MNKVVVWVSVFLGVLLLIVAYEYFVTPAQSLPHFLPGYQMGLTKTHFKHGVGALLLGLGVFAFAWFQSGKKSSE